MPLPGFSDCQNTPLAAWARVQHDHFVFGDICDVGADDAECHTTCFGFGFIAERICQQIDDADFVIADLALSSANVYLEIGYARRRGKHVIQTCREGAPLEFDLRGRRTLMYRNATILEEKLLRALEAMPGRDADPPGQRRTVITGRCSL